MKKQAVFGSMLVLLLLVMDQVSKYLAVLFLKDKPDLQIIPDVFSLHYLENRGSAFGMLQNQIVFFLLITVLVLGFAVFFLRRLPPIRRFLPLRLIGYFLIAGALGNFIDRILHAYVIDFFYFSLINFPVFNVADIYITVSTIVLFILVVFVYKEEDFSYLKKKKTDKEEP